MEDSVNIYSTCKTFRLWGNVYLLPLKSSENSLVFEGSQACGVKTSGKKGFLLCKWEQSPVSIKCLRIENVLRLGEFHDGGIIIKGTIM